ncbi:hypothetical protein M0R72_00610 [Candidatus Pacearchaeota archaeon]|nr:hypothetical protein [Candidatus Pacearchaeota archaeon]
MAGICDIGDVEDYEMGYIVMVLSILSMLGCCVDKKYGKGCTEETCMQLPKGKTCGDCGHIARCKAM